MHHIAGNWPLNFEGMQNAEAEALDAMVGEYWAARRGKEKHERESPERMPVAGEERLWA